MLMKVYVVHDSKAECYLPPFHMKSKGDAMRALQALIDDPQHNFCKYAEDFTLFEVGTWDDTSAKYNLLPTPHSIFKFNEVKKYAPVNGGAGESPQ